MQVEKGLENLPLGQADIGVACQNHKHKAVAEYFSHTACTF